MQLSTLTLRYSLFATWGVFALLALAWTGAAWLAAWLVDWAAAALASGTAAEAARSVSGAPVPQWIGVWIDPAWVQALQGALGWLEAAGRAALPFLDSAAGWLQPLVWVGWGFGLALMLVAAGGTHLLLRRLA